MELYPPDPLAGFRCRLDTLDRGVVTVDEKGLPTLRERILKRESVLVILAEAYVKNVLIVEFVERTS